MMPARVRQCLHCGMSVTAPQLQLEDLPAVLTCPKCDENLYLQDDGSCLTRDIAHQHETVSRALQKLDTVLLEAWMSYAQTVRVITGGGQIRRQVLGQLHYYQQQRRLWSWREETPNTGAILITVRPV